MKQPPKKKVRLALSTAGRDSASAEALRLRETWARVDFLRQLTKALRDTLSMRAAEQRKTRKALAEAQEALRGANREHAKAMRETKR